MRVAIIGIAFLFLGCGQAAPVTEANVTPAPISPAPSLGEQVPLLTQQTPVPSPGPGIVVGCYTYYQNALLVVDMTYGTAMADERAPAPPAGSRPQPVMWPFGYTGFRVGSEVAVISESGNVVAITGQRFWITMAGHDPAQPNVPDNVYAACGPPTPEALVPWPTVEPHD